MHCLGWFSYGHFHSIFPLPITFPQPHSHRPIGPHHPHNPTDPLHPANPSCSHNTGDPHRPFDSYRLIDPHRPIDMLFSLLSLALNFEVLPST